MKKLNYIGLLGAVISVGLVNANTASAAPCVHIYYDYSADPDYELGKVYSIMLQNLLGHFPAYQQIVEPIENYQAGDLNKCKANFYIGSYFDNYVPPAFISDYQTTNTNVMWIGYNIWMMGNDKLRSTFGMEYKGLTTLNKDKKSKDGKPSYYKNIKYKGETFPKYGEWDKKNPAVFNAAWEQTILKFPMVAIDPRKPDKKKEVKDPETVILAEAENSASDGGGWFSSDKSDKLPYAVRKRNRFYVADIPFAFTHEADRYLVFTDLLFDVLGESPRYPGKKPAVMRLEDVSPCTGQDELKLMAEVFKDKKIPFNLALIPIYANPTNQEGDCPGVKWEPMTTRPDFQNVVNQLRAQGAGVVWHGVTHQRTEESDPNGPLSGMTGDDFEFWEETQRVPLPEDSAQWAIKRLHMGWDELVASGIRPQIWEFPHYEGSALDYLIVSRLFAFHIGRIAYSNFKATGVPAQDSNLWFEKSGAAGLQARLNAFSNIHVDYSVTKRKPFNMMYPYETYGDIYGQRVLPENLNYVTKWGKDKRQGEATIADMIENLKRNRVLRDVWASYFIHPYLLETKDKGPLKKLVDETRDAGYEFVNLEQFIADKKHITRPPTIVKELGQID